MSKRKTARQQKQQIFCRYCNSACGDANAAPYHEHLKTGHSDVFHKAGLSNLNNNNITLKDINEALDRTDGNGNGDGNGKGHESESANENGSNKGNEPDPGGKKRVSARTSTPSLKRENSRSGSPPKRSKARPTSSPSAPVATAGNDPDFGRRSTPKGTLWNPEPEGHQHRQRQADNTSSQWSRARNPAFSSTNAPSRPLKSTQPPPGGGELGRPRHTASNPGVLPAPAHVLPGQDPPPVMIKEPETRPISQEQLVAEVKGIYAGLVMVESKCIEVDNAQAAQTDPATNRLNPEQWQALIALHRTLLHEHHDFFLASQHPSASPALKRLASKYAMPARMWRHGIHAFLELLRYRLPVSLEHMLSFIYLSYSMMALLCETVPAFEDTWIECLGDLGRYRMAIEDEEPRDREVWTNVSIHWYSKAADKAPTTGRLYHHLAILARPMALQQLFYYTKSLCVAIRFDSARESIMTLLDPIMDLGPTQPSRLTTFELEFVRCHGIMFSGKHKEKFKTSSDDFINSLDDQVDRSSRKFLGTAHHMASATCCSIIGYGDDKNPIYSAIIHQSSDESIDQPMADSGVVHDIPEQLQDAVKLGNRAHDVIIRRFGDPNILPYLHVVLIFMHFLTFMSKLEEVDYVFKEFPWTLLSMILNTLLLEPSFNSPDGYSRIEGEEFPKSEKVRPLPEDYALRGMLWVERYFPDTWFTDDTTDDDEKHMEFPSMEQTRKERVLWLACRIAAKGGKWLRYDATLHRFSVAPEFDVPLEVLYPNQPAEELGEQSDNE